MSSGCFVNGVNNWTAPGFKLTNRPNPNFSMLVQFVGGDFSFRVAEPYSCRDFWRVF